MGQGNVTGNFVESSIQFSNTFIEDLLKVYEFAEKNSPYL